MPPRRRSHSALSELRPRGSLEWSEQPLRCAAASSVARVAPLFGRPAAWHGRPADGGSFRIELSEPHPTGRVERMERGGLAVPLRRPPRPGAASKAANCPFRPCPLRPQLLGRRPPPHASSVSPKHARMGNRSAPTLCRSLHRRAPVGGAVTTEAARPRTARGGARPSSSGRRAPRSGRARARPPSRQATAGSLRTATP